MVLFNVYDTPDTFIVFCSSFAPEEFDKTNIPEVYKDVYYHFVVTRKITVAKPMLFFSNKILQNKSNNDLSNKSDYVFLSFCVIVEPINSTKLTSSLDYINHLIGNTVRTVYIGSCSLGEDKSFTDYSCGENKLYQQFDSYSIHTINLTNKTIFVVRTHLWEFMDSVNKLFRLSIGDEYRDIIRDPIIGFDMVKFIDEQLKKINKIRKEKDREISETICEQIQNITFPFENI